MDSQAKEGEAEKKCQEEYGISMDVLTEVEKLASKYIFKENSKGANDEARLCLKSTEGCGWDACEDYPDFVKKLNAVWEKKVDGNGGKGKLKVKILFAEEDVMIGKKGKEYFEDCWTQEKCGRGIEVECVETKGTDHDSVTDPTKGFIGPTFSAAKSEP